MPAGHPVGHGPASHAALTGNFLQHGHTQLCSIFLGDQCETRSWSCLPAFRKRPHKCLRCCRVLILLIILILIFAGGGGYYGYGRWGYGGGAGIGLGTILIIIILFYLLGGFR